MIQIMRVSGNSLAPDFHEGDFVVIVKIPFFLHIKRIKSGDVIVFSHPDYGIMVKRVESIFPVSGEIWVQGNHPSSIDSRQFGPIQQKDVIGKIIWHISGQRVVG